MKKKKNQKNEEEQDEKWKWKFASFYLRFFGTNILYYKKAQSYPKKQVIGRI